jgi:hypothetical protein
MERTGLRLLHRVIFTGYKAQTSVTDIIKDVNYQTVALYGTH